VIRQAKVYMPEVVQIIERELTRYSPAELADMVSVHVPATPVLPPSTVSKMVPGQAISPDLGIKQP
jgi:hypothetical protein